MKIIKHWQYIALFILTVLSNCSKRTIDRATVTRAEEYYRLAQIELEEHGDNEQGRRRALHYFEEAFKLNQLPEYAASRATLLFRVRNYTAAQSAFQDLIADVKISDVMRSEVLNNYACLLAEIGRSEEALQLWDDLASQPFYITPECARINQGTIYVAQGDYQRAKMAYEAAISLAPSSTAANIKLAQLAIYYLEDSALARSALDRLLFLNPTSTQGAQLLSELEQLSVKKMIL